MKVFWLVMQLLIFVIAGAGVSVYLGGTKVDAMILFLLFTVGYRVAELHLKVDKMIESKDNPPIK